MVDFTENLSIRVKPFNVHSGDTVPVKMYSYAYRAPKMDKIEVQAQPDKVEVEQSIESLLEGNKLHAGGSGNPSSVKLDVPVTLAEGEQQGNIAFTLHYGDEAVDETVVKVIPEE